MRLPLKWLQEFVPLKASPEEAADLFTSIGLECEEIIEGEGTVILNLSTPSNRTDVLSIHGLAREVSARTGLPLLPLERQELAQGLLGTPVSIAIKDKRCERYLGVPLALSPKPHAELALKLSWMDRNPIHPVVDLANVVLFETGQPLHLFKRSAVSGGITVDSGRAERMEGLDGISYALEREDLLISSGGRAVALAGVLGGAEGAAGPGQGTYLLECAFFHPAAVRASARRLALSTDASFRFERGCDPLGYALGAGRYLWWISRLGWGGQDAPATLVGGDPPPPSHIPWPEGELERRLGFSLPGKEEERILSALGLERDGDGWLPPSFRWDLSLTEDLLEEVARIHGYQDLPETIPPATGAAATWAPGLATERLLVDILVRAGGRQEIRSSLLSQDLAQAGVPLAGGGTPPAVANPRSKERSHLRTALLPGLLAGHAKTRRHGAPSGWSFEVGTRFTGRGEERAVAVLLPQDTPPAGWAGDRPPGAAGSLKGLFAEVAGRWDLELTRVGAEIAGFLPGTARRFNAEGMEGAMGAVKIEVGSRTEVVWGGEAGHTLPWPPPHAIGSHPPSSAAVARDLTVRVRGEKDAGRVAALFEDHRHPFLESASLVVRYVDGEETALTWRLVLRGEKTLQDTEIAEVVAGLSTALAKAGFRLD